MTFPMYVLIEHSAKDAFWKYFDTFRWTSTENRNERTVNDRTTMEIIQLKRGLPWYTISMEYLVFSKNWYESG